MALVYVFPNMELGKYGALATQFKNSYMDHAPGATDHELYAVVNGEPLDTNTRKIFDPLPVNILNHNNWAKDLGAFMLAAQNIPCDLLVMMGSHVKFWKAGWLDRIADAFLTFGPSVGGTWAMQVPNPHIRTTFFWTSPELLLSYPHLQSESDRYAFEHGKDSIALWSKRMGFEPYQLTWDGIYTMQAWHPASLTESLARDQHTFREMGQ